MVWCDWLTEKRCPENVTWEKDSRISQPAVVVRLNCGSISHPEEKTASIRLEGGAERCIKCQTSHQVLKSILATQQSRQSVRERAEELSTLTLGETGVPLYESQLCPSLPETSQTVEVSCIGRDPPFRDRPCGATRFITHQLSTEYPATEPQRVTLSAFFRLVCRLPLLPPPPPMTSLLSAVCNNLRDLRVIVQGSRNALVDSKDEGFIPETVTRARARLVLFLTMW